MVWHPLLRTRYLKGRTRRLYFVGRDEELRNLKTALIEHGSAAITGHGGLGKSQLMTAFAERAENDGDVTGETFWVTADGEALQVVKAFATFVQILTGASISDTYRTEQEYVLPALRDALAKRRGHWLLCIDNVDGAHDAEVQTILGDVCACAEPKTGNEWVVVTSRCVLPFLWSRMHENQNIVLGPLSLIDAMCVLWRYRESLMTTSSDDVSILEAVNRFKSENGKEYSALQQLCGYEWRCSLAGLTLALVQAGTFISIRKCKFSDYLQRYQKAEGKLELELILPETNDSKLRKEQRAILKTWSINMCRPYESGRPIPSVPRTRSSELSF